MKQIPNKGDNNHVTLRPLLYQAFFLVILASHEAQNQKTASNRRDHRETANGSFSLS
jgi:hypothetical protein